MAISAKRIIDITVSIVALVFLAPLLLIVALATYCAFGWPVLFRQSRPGLRGEPFTLVKFRTMLEVMDAEGCPLTDSERLTPFGTFLRSTTLDELPGFWNVLKGDMSLVGPRPLLLRYLDRYTPNEARRHEVRPGLTGWAQVNGRNAISWPEKFTLDLWYVDHWSIGLDVKILALTVVHVLRRTGITSGGNVTMPEFGLDRVGKKNRADLLDHAPRLPKL